MTLYGAPQRLDTVLRPLVRAVQLAIGLTGSIILAVLGWWWWMPLPLVASFLAYESLFWLRADRPVRVTLNDTLTVDDRKRKQTWTLDPSTVTVATAHRRSDGEIADVRIVLADDDGVLGAVWLRVPADAPALPHTVDADLCDHLVGGDYGSLRALASGNRVARQRIDTDASALAWFAEHISEQAWSRTGARAWRGHAPELDLLGHHTTEPAEWLVFGDDLPLWGPGYRSDRTAILLHAGRGLDDTFAADRLSLAVLELGDVALAAPSRILMSEEPNTPTHEALLHTHSAELSGVLVHWLRHTSPDTWPPSVRTAVDDALALSGKIRLDI